MWIPLLNSAYGIGKSVIKERLSEQMEGERSATKLRCLLNDLPESLKIHVTCDSLSGAIATSEVTGCGKLDK